MKLLIYALSVFFCLSALSCKGKSSGNMETTTTKNEKEQPKNSPGAATEKEKTGNNTNAEKPKEEGTSTGNVTGEPTNTEKINRAVKTETDNTRVSKYQTKKLDLDDTAAEAPIVHE